MLGIKIFLLRTQFLSVFMLPELVLTIPVDLFLRFQEERKVKTTTATATAKQTKAFDNVTD